MPARNCSACQICYAVKLVQLARENWITDVNGRCRCLVLHNLLQALPGRSGVVGRELVLKFAFVSKLGFLDRLLHLAFSSPGFFPAAADEGGVLLR